MKATRRWRNGARRRWPSIQSQLEEMLGSTDLRELLDQAALEEVEAAAAGARPGLPGAASRMALHDLLLRLGDLTAEEVARAAATSGRVGAGGTGARAARAAQCASRGRRATSRSSTRARYRDALGTPLPPGLAEAFPGAGGDARWRN